MDSVSRTVAALLFASLALAAHDKDAPDSIQIRSCVTNTLTLFEQLGSDWSQPCASCHHRAADLLRRQLPDGGWGRKASLTADAYSTGETLVALRQSGVLEASDPSFQRGSRCLLNTQQKDGSWHVKTRLSSPAPISWPYVETGFPYREDQFISCAGTLGPLWR